MPKQVNKGPVTNTGGLVGAQQNEYQNITCKKVVDGDMSAGLKEISFSAAALSASDSPEVTNPEAVELDSSGGRPALVEEGSQSESAATTAETGETRNKADRTNVMTAVEGGGQEVPRSMHLPCKVKG